MNATDINLQLIFIGVAIVTFFYCHMFVKQAKESRQASLSKAILTFCIGAVCQLVIVWFGNMFDSANVWLVAHIGAGFVFGLGARLAVRFLSGKSGAGSGS